MAAKILLVEDDNNLREIYEARLLAEGYDIRSAKDGEEALVIAKAELPDLVISDVMMPRISGFEMLDILRNTDSLRDTKVIMLTALGQADDKTRANSLGADRYLVKSQVTLEDIVKTAHELLEGPVVSATNPVVDAATYFSPPVMNDVPVAAEPVAPSAATMAPPPDVTPVLPTPIEPSFAAASAVPQPAPLVQSPVATPFTTPTPPTPVPTLLPAVQSTTDQQQTVNSQIEQFIQTMPTAPPPVTLTSQDDAVLATAMHDLNQHAEQPVAEPVSPAPAPMPVPAAAPMAPIPPMFNDGPAAKKIIQPLNAPATKPNIHELFAQEEATGDTSTPPAATTTVFTPTNGAPLPLNQPLPAEPLMPNATFQPMTPPAPTVVPTIPSQPPSPVSTPPASTGFDPNSIAL